tara:strand:+ start:808 stop:1920 length:1113 start_codon:yes stop_codon:yes gene_type:complete
MQSNLKFNWPTVLFLSICPFLGLVGTAVYVYFYGVFFIEPLLLILFWFISGMGITMGYHRLFSHKSFKTNIFIEWILMICGSVALQNTILKWCSDHRKHHNFPEMEKDPYSIKKGFWHAHIGWILEKTPEVNNRITGVKDLEKKSAVVFQNKYYFHIALVVGFLIPLLIGFYYGRPLGALLWGVFLRITLVHHATFFVNSLCHYVGTRTYDVYSTARDSWIVSLFTFGEGYHNYHHKFPADFRNGVRWFAFDPSKWLISILSLFKLTKDLKRTNEYFVMKSKCDAIYNTVKSSFGNTSSTSKQNFIDSFELINKLFIKWKDIDPTFCKKYSKDELDYIKKYKREINMLFKDLKNFKSKILKNQKIQSNTI